MIKYILWFLVLIFALAALLLFVNGLWGYGLVYAGGAAMVNYLRWECYP